MTQGVGEVGTVMSSTLDMATSLGTFKISKLLLSHIREENLWGSSIFKHVKSFRI